LTRPADWEDRALRWVRDQLTGEQRKAIILAIGPETEAGRAWAVLCYEALEKSRAEQQEETFKNEGLPALKQAWSWLVEKAEKLATVLFSFARRGGARFTQGTMSDVSRKEFEGMKGDLQSAYRRLSNIKEEMKETMHYVRQTMEVGLTSFALAWALAKWGGAECSVSVIGVPVDLGGAVLLKGLAFSTLLGNYSGDAHAIGDGMLAVYLTKKGLGMGAKSAGRGGNLSVAGALPAANGYGGQTDAQLAAAMAALQIKRPAGLVGDIREV